VLTFTNRVKITSNNSTIKPVLIKFFLVLNSLILFILGNVYFYLVSVLGITILKIFPNFAHSSLTSMYNPSSSPSRVTIFERTILLDGVSSFFSIIVELFAVLASVPCAVVFELYLNVCQSQMRNLYGCSVRIIQIHSYF